MSTRPRPGLAATSRARHGFTLLELMIVLTLAGLTMGAVVVTFSGYIAETRTHRAAQLFSQDLALARTTAVRTRSPVIIIFDEVSLNYAVRSSATGDTLVFRRFGVNADIDLTHAELGFPGDSLVVSSRGVIDLSVLSSPLGYAQFSSSWTFRNVRFNSLGASKIENP